VSQRDGSAVAVPWRRLAIWVTHREARARRHGLTIYNLDVDPDVDF
jgi:hypothetical protein